jgi:hypothetical protein
VIFTQEDGAPLRPSFVSEHFKSWMAIMAQ